MKFKTSTGKIVTGKRLQRALQAVAEDWRASALAVHRNNMYPPHVTRSQKRRLLIDELKRAQRISDMTEPVGFWLWQRVNQKLTGKCVAFLP